MANAQRMGDNQTAELARSILDLNSDIGAGSINTVTELGIDKNLGFNVNVIESGYTGDPEIRLPYPPVKGLTSTVINNTPDFINVYPSITGGSINGEVDAYGAVPPDGKPYTFYCWENPLPGAWTWTPPATNQLVIPEMTVAHTNGVATYKAGVGGALTTSIGTAVSGGNLVLTGNWASQNVPTTVTRVKCYTNILPGDMDSEFDPDAIRVDLNIGFKNGASSSTYGSEALLIFLGQNSTFYEGSYAPTGTLASPPNVGDSGTMYFIYDLPTTVFPYNQIGTGGTFSRYYYTFGMQIPASAATKDYKFQFFLEYN